MPGWGGASPHLVPQGLCSLGSVFLNLFFFKPRSTIRNAFYMATQCMDVPNMCKKTSPLFHGQVTLIYLSMIFYILLIPSYYTESSAHEPVV